MFVKTDDRITADLFYPLSRFYKEADLPMPPMQRIEGEALPEPSRSLLVHDAALTPTLANFVGSPLRLKWLETLNDEEWLLRRVVMFDDRGRVLACAAIRIEIVQFPLRAQQVIRQGRVPLAAVMKDHHMAHRANVRGYFRVEADARMREDLQLTEDTTLYGRRNVITNHADQPLADALEILAPI